MSRRGWTVCISLLNLGFIFIVLGFAIILISLLLALLVPLSNAHHRHMVINTKIILWLNLACSGSSHRPRWPPLAIRVLSASWQLSHLLWDAQRTAAVEQRKGLLQKIDWEQSILLGISVPHSEVTPSLRWLLPKPADEEVPVRPCFRCLFRP